MNHKQQRRTPLPSSRSSKTLANRKSASHAQAHSRSVSTSSRSADVFHPSADSPDETVSGLPEYCMTCEKMIITPGNSILYCSTACRKKDASRPLSMHSALPTPSSIPTAASYFDLPEPDIVSPRSPTALRPVSMSFSENYISQPSSPIGDETHIHDDHGGEGFVHFPPFQPHDSSDRWKHTSRHKRDGNGSTTDGIPSLSHTPSSSIGTVGSVDPNLLRRYHQSTGFFHSRSVDLVMPSFDELKLSTSDPDWEGASLASGTSTRTAFRVAEGEDST